MEQRRLFLRFFGWRHRQRVPILNRVLLGPDQNLVNAYFALEGPWTERFGDGPALLDRRRTPLFEVADGRLGHSGDGVACVRLRGSLEGGKVQVLMDDARRAIENIDLGR